MEIVAREHYGANAVALERRYHLRRVFLYRIGDNYYAEILAVYGNVHESAELSALGKLYAALRHKFGVARKYYFAVRARLHALARDFGKRYVLMEGIAALASLARNDI